MNTLACRRRSTCRSVSASALSLAVAVVHEPKLLILDEPTSGVDPVARDQFWELLVELSRQHGVTIFISTHFMNEAERCDRISLMHAGKVLASDTPAGLVCAARQPIWRPLSSVIWKRRHRGRKAPAADLGPGRAAIAPRTGKMELSGGSSGGASPAACRRLLGYAPTARLELRRDPIRLPSRCSASVLLMFVLGFGISLDVEGLRFAVLDRDQSPESRAYVQNIAGSRYFIERPPSSTTPSSTGACEMANWRWPSTFPPISGAICGAARPKSASGSTAPCPIAAKPCAVTPRHAPARQQIWREATGSRDGR